MAAAEGKENKEEEERKKKVEIGETTSCKRNEEERKRQQSSSHSQAVWLYSTTDPLALAGLLGAGAALPLFAGQL